MLRHVFTSNSRSISRMQKGIAEKEQIKYEAISCQNLMKQKLEATMKKMNKSKLLQLLSRLWNGPSNGLGSRQAEQKMTSILRGRFPKAELIEVADVSGGCGAMFDVNVVAPEFKGLNIVKQHQLINEALKEEIKDMHGIRIRTSIPRP